MTSTSTPLVLRDARISSSLGAILVTTATFVPMRAAASAPQSTALPGATRGEPTKGITSSRYMCPMNARSAVSRSDVMAEMLQGSEDRTSTFDATGERAARHVSHREYEDDHNRDDHEQGGHSGVGLYQGRCSRRGIEAWTERSRRGHERVQSNRQVVVLVGVQHDVGTEEVVPVGVEADERQKSEERLGQREREVPEDPQLRGAVHAGGVDGFPGEAGAVVHVA